MTYRMPQHTRFAQEGCTSLTKIDLFWPTVCSCKPSENKQQTSVPRCTGLTGNEFVAFVCDSDDAADRGSDIYYKALCSLSVLTARVHDYNQRQCVCVCVCECVGARECVRVCVCA